MTRYAVKTRADSPALRKAAMAIEQAAWGSLGFLNFTRAHFAFYQQLLEEHADCQLCLVDEATGYPVAVGNRRPRRTWLHKAVRAAAGSFATWAWHLRMESVEGH